MSLRIAPFDTRHSIRQSKANFHNSLNRSNQCCVDLTPSWQRNKLSFIAGHSRELALLPVGFGLFDAFAFA